jgi:hypothetical protein
LQLAADPPNVAYAARLLNAALQSAQAADGEWSNNANALLTLAAAIDGDAAAAGQFLARVNALTPSRAERLAVGMERLLDRESEQPKDIGRLVVALTDRLVGEAPTRATRRARAAGLLASDRAAEALPLLTSLAKETPGGLATAELYAEALGQQADVQHKQASLAKWQGIESSVRPNDPRWRRAREARIALLTELGDADAAEKLRRLTRLLHPAQGD